MGAKNPREVQPHAHPRCDSSARPDKTSEADNRSPDWIFDQRSSSNCPGATRADGWLLSANEIVATYRPRMEIADGDYSVPEWDDEPWWHPQWLPVADNNGDLDIIDLRPGPGFGRLGVAVHDGGGDFSESWPSLIAYFDEVAAALSSDSPVGIAGYRPYLLGDLLWWATDDESVNGQRLTPAPIG